jgi:hypothetical protein
MKFPWSRVCQTSASALNSQPLISTFSAAGILFTNGKHVLAGYQPHKEVPKLSGIGGLREGDEHYMTTALRETLEELFGFAFMEDSLLAKLERKLPPVAVLQNENYVLVIMTFEQLERLLRIVKKGGPHQYLYEKFPETVADLVFQRKTTTTAEIQSFAVLPLIDYSALPGGIDTDFQTDLQLVADVLNPAPKDPERT